MYRNDIFRPSREAARLENKSLFSRDETVANILFKRKFPKIFPAILKTVKIGMCWFKLIDHLIKTAFNCHMKRGFLIVIEKKN